MSEDKDINVSIVPEFVDKALENVLDKPSKEVGNTFGDIWYLILGGPIGHMAEKRKIKYAKYLQIYKEKIEMEINRIPAESRVEADIQIVGPALEASKYCAEKGELRDMFAKLIASSMNREKKDRVHPILCELLGRITPFDAVIFRQICHIGDFDMPVLWKKREELTFSLQVMSGLGIIKKRLNSNSNIDEFLDNKFKKVEVYNLVGCLLDTEKISFEENWGYQKEYWENDILFQSYVLGFFDLTNTGKILKEICL